MTSLDDKNDIINYQKQRYFGSLNITEFGTIYSDYLEEQKLDDFLKKFKKKMKKNIEDYNINYDNEINKFIITLNSFKYLLEINDEAMEEYALGKRNNITAKLDELYKETTSKMEILDLKKEEQQKIKLKVNEIEQSNKLPSLADAPMYVKHLEEENKQATKEIRKEMVNLGITVAPFTIAGVTTGMLTGNPIIVMLATAVTIKGQDLLSLAISSESVYKSLEETFKNLSNKFKERKMIKHRIKQIKSIENYDKIVLANSYTIEETEILENPTEQNLLSFKNVIMSEIDKIVTKSQFTNEEDQKIVLNQTKLILEEYDQRYKNIINSDKSQFNPDADTELKLKQDILKKTTWLEFNLDRRIEKDKQIYLVENEKAQLVEKIDKIENKNKIESEIIQRKR